MKYLREHFRINKTHKNFVWADANANAQAQREASSENIDIKEILQKPYQLNEEKIQTLEKSAGSLTNKQKVQVRNVVGYWLTVSKKTIDRDTLELFRVIEQDSPELKNILGEFYQDKIKKILEGNKDLLETEFLKSELKEKNRTWKQANQFLKFADGQDDLLPTHVKTLDDIIAQESFDEVKPDQNITRHQLGEKAEKIKKDYTEKLEKRVQAHTLKASDMEVLLDEDVSTEAKPENHELVKKFRNAVSQVMGVQTSDELEETYLSSRYDKYSSWFDVEKAKEPDDIENLRKAIDGLNISEEEKEDPLYVSMREGLLKYFGDLVEGKMKKNDIENETKEGVEKTIDTEENPSPKETKSSEKENENEEKGEDSKEVQEDSLDQQDLTEEEKKDGIETMIEKEKKDFDTLLEDIENPEEKEKIEPTFDIRKDWLLEGREDLPGTEVIKNAREKTTGLQNKVKEVIGEIISPLIEIEERLKEFQEVEKRVQDFEGTQNAYVKNLTQQRTEARKKVVHLFQKLEKQWKTQKGDLTNIFEEFQNTVGNPKDKDNELSEKAKREYIEPLDQSLSILFSAFREKGMDIQENKQLISNCGERADAVKKYAEFGDSFWKEVENLVKENFEKGNEDVKFLKEVEFFSDKEKSKKEFQKIQADYAQKIEKYKEAYLETKKRIEKDMTFSSQEKFEEEYGMKKDEVKKRLHKAETEYKNLLKEWESIKDPKEIERLFTRYEKSLEGITDPEEIQEIQEEKTKAIDKVGELKQLEEKIQKIDTETTDMNIVLDKDTKEREAETILKKANKWLTNDWYFYSMSDVYEMVKASMEAFKRKEERRSEKAQANLGARFWDGFGSWIFTKDAGVIAAEFNRRREEANNKRVGEYEAAYQNKKAWELWNIINRKNSNIDEVQACLNKLNDLGALRLDDPILWKFINRMKGYKYMNIPQDLEELSLTEITAKVGVVLSDLYSQKEFDDWVKTKDSKRNSALGEWVGDYENADIGGKQHSIFVGMLQAWHKGETDKVEPARFLAYLKEAFERGQVNGYPDMRFYYLIQGITLKNPDGQTIISEDVLRYLNDNLLPKVPHFDFFKDKSSHKLNGRIVPKGTPGAEIRTWGYKDYLAWADFMTDANGTFNPKGDEFAAKRVGQFFDHFVHMSDDARGRVGRMFAQSKKEWDHDDAWMMIREWSPGNVLDAFRPGAYKSKDWIRGFLGAFPQYMQSMYEYIHDGDAEYGDAEYWKGERNRVLMEVGSRLKVAMLGMQVLAGNYLDEEERTKTAIFDEVSWRASTGYSQPLIKSREKINAMMDLVIDDMPEEKDVPKETLREMMTYNGYEISTKGRGLVEFAKAEGPYAGKGYIVDPKGGAYVLDDNGEKKKGEKFDPKYAEKQEKYGRVKNASKQFLSESGEDSVSAIFENTEVIERALNAYIEKGLYK